MDRGKGRDRDRIVERWEDGEWILHMRGRGEDQEEGKRKGGAKQAMGREPKMNQGSKEEKNKPRELTVFFLLLFTLVLLPLSFVLGILIDLKCIVNCGERRAWRVDRGNFSPTLISARA